METMSMVVMVYGVVVLLGGVMGYAKAKSVMSLISGILFGGALLFFGYGIKLGHKNDVTAALVLAGVLAVMMGVRFAKGKKFMPAGLVTVLSVAVVVTLLMLRG